MTVRTLVMSILAVLWLALAASVWPAVAEDPTRVTPLELDVSTPKVLPTDTFYPIKDWWRSLRLGLTFDAVKREDLRLHQMNERLMEVQALFDAPVDAASQQAMAKTVAAYQKQAEQWQSRATALQERLKDNEQIVRFQSLLSSNTDWELKRQYLLQRMEQQENVNQEVKDLLQSAMEESLGGVSMTLGWWQTAVALQQSVDRAVNGVSTARQLYTLETLSQLVERALVESRDAVEQARQSAEQQLIVSLQQADVITKTNLLNDFMRLSPSPPVAQAVSAWLQPASGLPVSPLEIKPQNAAQAIDEMVQLFGQPDLVQ
ncbi:hypothetical protein HY933_03420 [Candidatus Falkowbacteria bacterium]|nr:hypothetical protein [Candidatus Falkowbacteria bacterium]